MQIYATIESRSLAIAASTLDSLLDLMAGGILWLTHLSMKNINIYKYPIGKLRVQPVGIIIFAAVMATLGKSYLVEFLFLSPFTLYVMEFFFSFFFSPLIRDDSCFFLFFWKNLRWGNLILFCYLFCLKIILAAALFYRYYHITTITILNFQIGPSTNYRLPLL